MQPDEQVLYEGKAKQLLPTSDPEVFIQRFKDSATAFNGQKYAELPGKGRLNNAISSLLFERLEAAGVKTHYLGKVNGTDMRVRRLSIIPLEVVARNVAAGSLSKRLGLPEGQALPHPIVETYYKNDALGDPILCDAHVEVLGLCRPELLAQLKARALAVNQVLLEVFESVGVRLIDLKLEFGLTAQGELLLGDEISPDTSRLWDAQTSQRLDKDVFRRELGDLVQTYAIVAAKLGL